MYLGTYCFATLPKGGKKKMSEAEHSAAVPITDTGPNVADRMERLPFSSFHRKFIGMVAAGEFVENLMLLGNGLVLAVVAKVLHFSPAVSTFAVPVSFFFGEFVGSIVSGYIADRLGRKTVFLYDLLAFGIGMIIAGFTSSAALIALCVFIAGLGAGGEFPVVDTYTSEMMPGEARGRRVASVYTIAIFGAPVIAVLVYALSHPAPGPYSYRILFWIMGGAAIIVWIIRFRIPESPRWLEIRGRRAEADRLVSDIERQAMLEHGLSELPPVRTSTQVDERAVRYRDIFARDLRGRMVMMLVFQFFNSGIFYGFASLAPLMLEKKGISLVHTLAFSMIIYAGFFVGSFTNIFIIDRVERKWGLVGSLVAAGIFGTLFAVTTNVTATVVLGFLVAFALFHSSNFSHTYNAEIFPTRVRSTAAGTAYSVSRISTSILVPIITTMFLPHGLLATFGVIWLFVIVVAVDIGVFGPKTSQLRLEHISK